MAASTAQANSNGGNSFPPFETEWFASQIFWLALCFGALYLMMSRYILPRFSTIIEQRQDRIARDTDDACRIQIQADKTMQKRIEKLQSAHAMVREQIAATKAKTDREAILSVEQTDTLLEKEFAELQAKIAEQHRIAMQNIDKAVQETAATIISKLTGSDPDKKLLQVASENSVKNTIQ